MLMRSLPGLECPWPRSSRPCRRVVADATASEAMSESAIAPTLPRTSARGRAPAVRTRALQDHDLPHPSCYRKPILPLQVATRPAADNDADTDIPIRLQQPATDQKPGGGLGESTQSRVPLRADPHCQPCGG